MIDQERFAAADQARRQIEAFIRRTLPAGSPAAYSAGELVALNQQRLSTQTFDPYAARPQPPAQPTATQDDDRTQD